MPLWTLYCKTKPTGAVLCKSLVPTFMYSYFASKMATMLSDLLKHINTGYISI